MMRTAEITRKTLETTIISVLKLDGGKEITVSTGIGFFDHMMKSFALHAGLSLSLSCSGDLDVDGHHTVEDCGIVIGQLLNQVLGDKSAIARYGWAKIPMDEAVAECVLDISGRPYLVFGAEFDCGKIGKFDTQLCEEFFRAVAFNAGFTLHISCPYGKNDHHKAEAMFKAFARALRMAVKVTGEENSAKGMLGSTLTGI